MDEYITIALPKGRLGEKVYKLFAEAGFDCDEVMRDSRKLIFENTEKKIRYFWAKPSDVTVYVEGGTADIGVAGKDIILEYKPEIYELMDLHEGRCRMCVAGKIGFEDDLKRPLRVATKFTNIAENYFNSQGREINIIKLNGSIEIAPVLGLSDVIVDIVETGTTLKENNLSIISEIMPISARLVANKSSYSFKRSRIDNLVKLLSVNTEDENV